MKYIHTGDVPASFLYGKITNPNSTYVEDPTAREQFVNSLSQEGQEAYSNLAPVMDMYEQYQEQTIEHIDRLEKLGVNVSEIRIYKIYDLAALASPKNSRTTGFMQAHPYIGSCEALGDEYRYQGCFLSQDTLDTMYNDAIDGMWRYDEETDEDTFVFTNESTEDTGEKPLLRKEREIVQDNYEFLETAVKEGLDPKELFEYDYISDEQEQFYL